jgi:hypothetical protein
MPIEQYSNERLEELIGRWNNGALESYEERCELVYEIHKETSKPGCSGGFSAALRPMDIL